jgi:hypothetical protein
MRLLSSSLAGFAAIALILGALPAQADTEETRAEMDRPSLGVILGQREDRVVVAHVIKDGPADEAGLERGDEIRRVDGERVRGVRELLNRIHEKDEGDSIEVEVRRDDESQTMELTLASLRDVRRAARADDRLRQAGRQLSVDARLAALQAQVMVLAREVARLQRDQGETQVRDRRDDRDDRQFRGPQDQRFQDQRIQDQRMQDARFRDQRFQDQRQQDQRFQDQRFQGQQYRDARDFRGQYQEQRGQQYGDQQYRGPQAAERQQYDRSR